MFTWKCPQCGRPVSPAYTECPHCAEPDSVAAGSQPAAPSPVTAARPTPPPPPIQEYTQPPHLPAQPPYQPPRPAYPQQPYPPQPVHSQQAYPPQAQPVRGQVNVAPHAPPQMDSTACLASIERSVRTIKDLVTWWFILTLAGALILLIAASLRH
jgi:hypothetical protein